MKLIVETFFDKETSTLTYLLYNKLTKEALVIDPVLDLIDNSNEVSNKSISELINIVKDKELNLKYVLETHAHADHLSAAQELKKSFPLVKIGVGENIVKVQETFTKVYGLEDFNSNGEQFDVLLKDDDVISLGDVKINVLSTPGHTPACVSFYGDGKVFTGDALFMPDSGTGRCDFPDGSAKDLYNSVHNKLYKLDDRIEVYTGHDYQPNNREVMFKSTIEENKKFNVHLKESTSEEEFIEYRTNRDESLSAPRLLYQSIQVNIDAGVVPLVNNKVKFKKPRSQGE